MGRGNAVGCVGRVLFSHVHFDMSNRHPSALGHEHCSASFFVSLPPASARKMLSSPY